VAGDGSALVGSASVKAVTFDSVRGAGQNLPVDSEL